MPTGAIRKLAEVITVSTPDFVRPVAKNNTGIAQWLTESGSPVNATPEYEMRKPSFGILGAEIDVLHTAIEDLSYDAVGDALKRAAIDFARVEAGAFVNGVASPAVGPAGIMTNIQTVKAESVNVASLAALVGSLKSEYLANGSFVMSTSVFHSLLGVADDNGRPIAAHGIFGASPNTVFGYPVYFDENLPEDKPVLFGDIRAGYLVADRVGTSISVNPYANFAGVKLWVRKRSGGIVTIREAVKAIELDDGNE